MNKIEFYFEKLYLDVCDFSREFKKLSDIVFPLPFIEEIDKVDPKIHQKEQLEEILKNIKTISDRFIKDVDRIDYYLKYSKNLNKEETVDVNQSFGDLLTEYEIIFSKYKSYKNKYKFDEKSEKTINLIFEKFIASMTKLDESIYKYNLKNIYKILQPYEESKLAKSLQVFGFSFVDEKEISELIVYR